MALALPARLVETVEGRREAGLRDWVGDLPRVVADVAERWTLQVGDPFQPGGSCSWVAPVRDAAGRDLVLKLGWRHFEAAHEAHGLALWAGDGAIALHAAHTFDRTSALLLERCVPGTTLSEVVAQPEQDIVVAGLLGRLWREPPAGQPFRPLHSMCEQWAVGFEHRLARSPASVDPGLAAAGLELFRTLPGTADRRVVLCTDLHAGNILAAQREPWLVCDPKPYLGDPTYDVLQHLLNCDDRLVADPVGLAGRMADLLDIDEARLVQWLFARCVLESIDSPMLRTVAARLAPA